MKMNHVDFIVSGDFPFCFYIGKYQPCPFFMWSSVEQSDSHSVIAPCWVPCAFVGAAVSGQKQGFSELVRWVIVVIDSNRIGFCWPRSDKAAGKGRLYSSCKLHLQQLVSRSKVPRCTLWSQRSFHQDLFYKFSVWLGLYVSAGVSQLK